MTMTITQTAPADLHTVSSLGFLRTMRELEADQRYDLREHQADTITLKVAGVRGVSATVDTDAALRQQRLDGALDSESVLELMRAAGQDTARLEQKLAARRSVLERRLQRDGTLPNDEALTLADLDSCGIEYDGLRGTLTVPACY